LDKRLLVWGRQEGIGDELGPALRMVDRAATAEGNDKKGIAAAKWSTHG